MLLITRPDAGIPVTVQARTALAPVRALELIGPIDLPSVFIGWGPFPAVTSVDGQTGDWTGVGETRHPNLSDGGTVTETLTEYTPGVGFAYELTGFTDVFDRMVDGVRGEWTFTPDGSGSIVKWTWEFKAKPRFGVLLRRVITPLYGHYMQQIVDRSVEVAERLAGLAAVAR